MDFIFLEVYSVVFTVFAIFILFIECNRELLRNVKGVLITFRNLLGSFLHKILEFAVENILSTEE